MSKTELFTDEWIKTIRYFDGPLVCDNKKSQELNVPESHRKVPRDIKQSETNQVPLQPPLFGENQRPSDQNSQKIEQSPLTKENTQKVQPPLFGENQRPSDQNSQKIEQAPTEKAQAFTYESPKEEDHCPGFLEISYTIDNSISEINSEVFNIHDKLDKEEVLTILRDSNPHGELILTRLHNLVVNIHKPILDISKLEAPKLGLLFDWEKNNFYRAGVLNQPTNVDIISFIKTIVEPVKGAKINLVNSDFSGENTWESGFDGAIFLSEMVLQKTLGLGKPKWMSEEMYGDIRNEFDLINKLFHPTNSTM